MNIYKCICTHNICIYNWMYIRIHVYICIHIHICICMFIHINTANDSIHDARTRLNISSQQLPWQRSFCTVAWARIHECMCTLCGEYACISTGVVSTLCTFYRCCEHQCTHLRTRSLPDVHMCSCMCSLLIQCWGTRMVGSNQCRRVIIAWRGGLLLTEGEIGVLSVSSLFLTQVGVYVGVGMCIGSHTHTLHIQGTRM